MVKAYNIKVKDGVFYKNWTPLTTQRWSTKEKATASLNKYLRDMKHLNRKNFKITLSNADRRFG